MDNKAIGKMVQAEREKKNLTLQDVADSVGIARSTILRYEKGHIGKIKLPVLMAIAKCLNVEYGYLMGLEEKGKPVEQVNSIAITLRNGDRAKYKLTDAEISAILTLLESMKKV